MAEVPGGASGLLCRDYKGKEADRLVTRIDPGVVSMVAELRAHKRQAAEELRRGQAPAESKPATVNAPVNPQFLVELALVGARHIAKGAEGYEACSAALMGEAP